MSSANRVKVHSFSGATTTDMKHFTKPLVQQKPTEIILHVGTNDVDIHSAEEVADNIMYTPLAKLLARCARLGRTRYISGNHAENHSSISATNQHQMS